MLIVGGPLKPYGYTQTIRRDGASGVIVEDEPFSAGDPPLLSFELINAKSMEHAIEIGKTHPALVSPTLVMEVREYWDAVDIELGGAPE